MLTWMEWNFVDPRDFKCRSKGFQAKRPRSNRFRRKSGLPVLPASAHLLSATVHSTHISCGDVDSAVKLAHTDSLVVTQLLWSGSVKAPTRVLASSRPCGSCSPVTEWRRHWLRNRRTRRPGSGSSRPSATPAGGPGCRARPACPPGPASSPRPPWTP